MIRRSPSENYIKFLLLQPGSTDEQVKEFLLTQQLDPISSTYLSKLRQQCTPPTPFHPRSRYHSPSQQFLLQHGVRDLFLETPEVKMALRLLNSPRAKEFIEAMTLAGAPTRAIALAVSQQCRKSYSAESIAAYQRYFWNIDLVDSTEMKALLIRRQERGTDSTDAEVKGAATAWKKASYTDPRRVAAALPHSPVSAMISQIRMGSMPNLSELSNLVQMTRMVAVARAYEASVYGGPEDSGNAMNYAITAEKMGNILEQIVKPDEDLLSQLGSIALRTNAAGAVPLIHALSDGQHTVDLMPGDQEREPAPKPPQGP